MPESLSPQQIAIRRPIAVVVGWLVPGAGHWLLGERMRGAILFVAIAATFWLGVAIGGVRSSIDPAESRAWFAAQLLAGGHTLGVLAIRRSVPDRLPYIAGWPSANVGMVYCGVSGLLNVLALLHVVAWPGLGDAPQAPKRPETEGSEATG